MNLLQMLTQKKTDPLTQFVDRERMIRRNPTKFVGDFLTRAGGGDPDAGMLDLVDPKRERLGREADSLVQVWGSPNAGVFDYTKSPLKDDVLGLPPLTDSQKKEIQGGFMETPEQKEKKKKRQEMMKGMVTGVGDLFANALQQQPQSPLNFAPLQMGGQSFLIEPTFLQARGLQRREDGGPVKKRQPYLVGEDGPEVIVPNEDGMVIPNRRNINWDVEAAPTAPTQTETVTETVTEPSIADKLRVQIEEYQDPDRYKKGSPRYDKKRNWKDALRSAGYGILQALASAPANSDTASMLGRAIGGAATGGVMGATMDNVDEKMRDQFKLAQLVPQYKEAYGMERQKKADDLQAENTRADNEINRLRIETVQQAKKEAEKGKALGALNKLKKFDPTDPTQAALAKAAGLDPTELKGWDDRSPVLKQVGDTWYAMDRETGVFAPTNLPKDEAKSLVDYKVKMPNGEQRTYRVPQKDAAKFATQMEIFGVKMELAEKRLKLDQAKFTEAKQQFATQTMLRSQAMISLEAARASGNAQDVARYQLELEKHDATLQRMRQALLEAKTKGELDDLQFGELDGFFQQK